MYREKHYDYSGVEGKWFKDELKKWGFHHATISSLPADFFRMSKSQLEKLFEHASDAFISKMYDVPIHQIQNRRSDFDIKQLGCTLNRMEREEETAQIFKEILRIVSNEYNNGNIPHTNSTPLNSEKEFLYMKATGIVRRIDAGVIITPKPKNCINTGFSLIFVQLNLQKNPFKLVFRTKKRGVAYIL